MKRKAFAALMAGTLAMATAVPATAADGGSVDVTVGTKTGVIRVVVPTTLEVAVDQFEKGVAGTQIHSTGFDIENKSDIAVKVSVTSEATLGSKVGLLESRADVENSTSKDGELWLAAAALLADGKYQNTSGDDDLSALDETENNVTTFAAGEAGKASASQVFYLDKGTGATEYKLLKPAEAGKATVSYAQFYKLQALADETAYDAAHAAGDVYYIATTDAGTDGKAVTKLEKDDTHTYNGTTNSYFTAATTVTEVEDLTTSDVYVYAGMATAGSKAGFRYIGQLNNAKETWSATDFSNVKITYTIAGVGQTGYDDVSTDLSYGLLPSKAPVFTADASTAGLINFTAGLGELALDADADIQVWHEYAGQWYDAAADVTVDKTTKKITYKAESLALFAAAGDDFKVQVTFTCEDGSTKTADIVVKAK